MKNDTINSLFNDNTFMFNSLLDLINDEAKRIASLSLVNKKDLDAFVIPSVKEAVNMSSVNDKLLALSQVHAALRSIKLPSDFKKMAGFIEFDITTNNNDYSLKAIGTDDLVEHKSSDVECCEKCTTGDQCCDKQPVEDTYNKANEFIFDSLEKIAYNSGVKGKQEVAYAIEKFITYNKDSK